MKKKTLSPLTEGAMRSRDRSSASSLVPVSPPSPSSNGPSISQRQMADAFNTWAERYAEDPDSFSDILDEEGNVVSDYGMRCAIYFSELLAERE